MRARRSVYLLIPRVPTNEDDAHCVTSDSDVLRLVVDVLTRRLCAAGAAVYVWGRGEYGRLGLGDKSGSSRLKATLVESLVHETVVQAVCGGTHTMALTVEGRIYIWGRGSFGNPSLPYCEWLVFLSRS